MAKCNMLIVDDSTHLHTLVRTCLEPEPLVVHSAYDGDSGIRAASELGPQLVLLDVNMPGANGFEVCQRLKTDPKTSDAMVMFLTVDGSPLDVSKGLSLGASDYITKPFKPEKLRAQVRSAVRNHRWQGKSLLVDGLTGLWNEFYLDEDLASQVAWANHCGHKLACIIAQIDPRDRPDEHYGDVAGEEILRAVAAILLRHCRGSEDTVYYCGNRKFAAVLYGMDSAGAERVTERIQLQIERDLRGDDEDAIVHCSFGVADTGDQTGIPLLERTLAAAHRARQVQPVGISLGWSQQSPYHRNWLGVRFQERGR